MEIMIHGLELNRNKHFLKVLNRSVGPIMASPHRKEGIIAELAPMRCSAVPL